MDPYASGSQTRRSSPRGSSASESAAKVLTLKQSVPIDWMVAAQNPASPGFPPEPADAGVVREVLAVGVQHLQVLRVPGGW